MSEYEYCIRWRNARNQVRELGREQDFPQTLRKAIEAAKSICKGYDAEVCVIENGSLICIVRPD